MHVLSSSLPGKETMRIRMGKKEKVSMVKITILCSYNIDVYFLKCKYWKPTMTLTKIRKDYDDLSVLLDPGDKAFPAMSFWLEKKKKKRFWRVMLYAPFPFPEFTWLILETSICQWDTNVIEMLLRFCEMPLRECWYDVEIPSSRERREAFAFVVL